MSCLWHLREEEDVYKKRREPPFRRVSISNRKDFSILFQISSLRFARYNMLDWRDCVSCQDGPPQFLQLVCYLIPCWMRHRYEHVRFSYANIQLLGFVHMHLFFWQDKAIISLTSRAENNQKTKKTKCHSLRCWLTYSTLVTVGLETVIWRN
jgi:hypothetical protein